MVRNFGLISKSDGKKVPLESIKIEASVSGFTAHVTSTLQYNNKEVNPIEAIYIFPLDEQAAVCGFQATIDGKTVVAEVREKQKAKDIYDDAISSGQSAFLLEESDESSDIFQISVGNLPPKRSATVELRFVTELAVEKEGRVVFVLPNVLRPRYSPAGTGPSLSSQVPSVPSVESPYSFDFEMKVEAPSAINDVSSPSGSLDVQIDDNDKKKALVRLGDEHKGDRDIEVHILTAEPFRPHAVVEDGFARLSCQSEDDFMTKPVVMLNFFPEFRSESLTAGEFIFIVDRSGSMSGDRIKSASETLLLFLKSLPSGCHFNVIGFGSHHEKLFKKSEAYGDKSLEDACRYAENMAANLGGTEILEPLQWVFSQPLMKGAPRQVFLLTDGSVGNTPQVIELVQKNANSARCFSFGIGEGASTALIKGVARAGRGKAVFITSKDRLQAKVVKSLKQALQPVLLDVKLVWKMPKGWTAKQIPSSPPPLFSGDRLIMYAVLDKPKRAEALQASVSLQASLLAQSSQTAVHHSFFFQMEPVATGITKTLHRLTAKCLIQELQDTDKSAVIGVSQSANVISKHTSFVAVDEETRDVIAGSMCSQVIPRPLNFDRAKCARIYSGGGGIRKCKKKGAMMCLAASPPPPPPPSNSAPFWGGQIVDQQPPAQSPRASTTDVPKEVSSMDIVVLQRASGAWELTEKLAGACGLTLPELVEACPKTVSIESDEGKLVWATALALMLLMGKFAATSDEWEMIAEKAKAWLHGNLPTDVDYIALTQDAKAALHLV